MAEKDTAVIGVLLQDLSLSLQYKYDPKIYTSSLGASYVNFVKDSGARCLPIALRQKPEYYKNIVEIIDAILLPGGGFSLADSKGYTPSGKLLLDAATSAAKDGRPIPIFGICLGFELMAEYFAEKNDIPFDILTRIPINNGWHQLTFTDEAASSTLLSAELFGKLQENSDRLCHVFHRQCITMEKFRMRLGNDWRVLATEEVKKSEDGEETLTVITMMESKSKPYFGVQFHPEKATHESGPRRRCPNIDNAESVTRYFNLLLTQMVEAQNEKQNVHSHFPKTEWNRLIDRYTAEDVREDTDIKYDYVYLFRDGDLVI